MKQLVQCFRKAEPIHLVSIGHLNFVRVGRTKHSYRREATTGCHNTS